MRSRVRRAVLARVQSWGKWVRMGPQVRESSLGVNIPKRLTVIQRGRPVSRNYADGSRDRPDWW